MNDKAMHALFGLGAGLAAVLLVLVSAKLGLPAAVLAAGTMIGAGYELTQWLRGDGEPSWLDAAATAGGAALAALLVHATGLTIP